MCLGLDKDEAHLYFKLFQFHVSGAELHRHGSPGGLDPRPLQENPRAAGRQCHSSNHRHHSGSCLASHDLRGGSSQRGVECKESILTLRNSAVILQV